ncbi:hypothetical protein DOY81_014626, partial [Sarcophaga bullata]
MEFRRSSWPLHYVSNSYMDTISVFGGFKTKMLLKHNTSKPIKFKS